MYRCMAMASDAAVSCPSWQIYTATTVSAVHEAGNWQGASREAEDLDEEAAFALVTGWRSSSSFSSRRSTGQRTLQTPKPPYEHSSDAPSLSSVDHRLANMAAAQMSASRLLAPSTGISGNRRASRPARAVRVFASSQVHNDLFQANVRFHVWGGSHRGQASS